jgi:hypothetical protein
MCPYGYSRGFELQAFTSEYDELLKALKLLLREDNNYWVLSFDLTQQLYCPYI